MGKNQNTSNTSVYTWTEDQSDRDSNENKNTNTMMFLLNYILKSRTFNRMEHYFPIRGHSYMPPDRDTILGPNEYHNVFATCATVNALATDWVISNFLDASKKTLVKKTSL
ncbi:hypothetical protein PR048_022488 [Dryococelus australis]|uniref:Uncharacterized protein n=1 Tax=Dryococelus australis TaxID=614101 RepID=A0ABQ9H143_9NEOP|nr:hypothetical protein PR048_022488 [Dryococelus australis]